MRNLEAEHAQAMLAKTKLLIQKGEDLELFILETTEYIHIGHKHFKIHKYPPSHPKYSAIQKWTHYAITLNDEDFEDELYDKLDNGF
jgi:hypothetical protein